jgi:hypothetical protein
MAATQIAQFRSDRDLPEFTLRSRHVDAIIAALTEKAAVIASDRALEAPSTLVAHAEQSGLLMALVNLLGTDLVEILDTIVFESGGDLDAYDARTIVMDYASDTAGLLADARGRAQVLARLIWIVTDHQSDRARALALGVEDMPEYVVQSMQGGEPHHFVAAMLRPRWSEIDQED